MPKRVLETLVRQLDRVLRVEFKPGDRFLTVAAVAKRFGCSYATAFKAVKKMTEAGYLVSRPGNGLFVVSATSETRPGRKKIVLMSYNEGREFNQGFKRGIEEVAEPEGISVDLVVANTLPDIQSVLFGDYIAGLEADGVITIAYTDAALGFYRAMVLGVDIVADIAMPELPMLPVVQTDNFRHGGRAAEIMARSGYREALLLVQSDAPGIIRDFYRQRIDGFKKVAREAGITTNLVCLVQSDFMDCIDSYFYRWNNRKAVFSIEMCCNHIAVLAFTRHNIPIVDNNLLVYDSHAQFHLEPDRPPVATVGPSLKELGRGLAKKLIDKWNNGSFSEPLQEML